MEAGDEILKLFGIFTIFHRRSAGPLNTMLQLVSVEEQEKE